MKADERGPVELVKWMDSVSETDWNSALSYQESYPDSLYVWSVGFLVHESTDRLVLLQSDGGKQWHSTLTIPKVCVVERIRLEEGGAGEQPTPLKGN